MSLIDKKKELEEQERKDSASFLSKITLFNDLNEILESRGIPPIAFYLGVVALIAVLIFVLFFSGAPVEEFTCGDGVCLEGEELSCPADCEVEVSKPKGDVLITLSRGSCDGTLHVTLYDDEGDIVSAKDTLSSTVAFSGVEAYKVYAVITNGDGKSITSNTVDIKNGEVYIIFTLPSNFCESNKEYGTIKVSVLDSSTDEPIVATVSIMSHDGRAVEQETVDGSKTFTNIASGTYYYVIVNKIGYAMYNGASAQQMLTTNSETSFTVRLESLGPATGTEGELEVCVRDHLGEVVVGSGKVKIYSADGVEEVEEDMSNYEYFSENATELGCITFSLPVGQQFYAMVTGAPDGCSNSGMSDTKLIGEDIRQVLYLDVDCNLTGAVQVVVKNETDVLTTLVNTSLYDSDNGSVIAGGDGIYLEAVGDLTEPIYVPAGMEVYAKAFDYPERYWEDSAVSDTIIVEENTTNILEINLELPPPPLPPLSISSYSVTPSSHCPVGENLRILVDKIVLEGEDITNNKELSLKVMPSWNLEEIAMAYEEDKGWVLELSSPEEPGEYSFTIKTSLDDAEDAQITHVFYVITEAAMNLMVESLPSSTIISPITLNFAVKFSNGTLITHVGEMVYFDSNVTIFICNNPSCSSREKILESELRRSQDNYTVSFDVPFRGAYTAVVSVKAQFGDTLYMGSGERKFEALSAGGAELTGIVPAAARPGEQIELLASLDYFGKQIPNQEILAQIRDKSYTMLWNEEAGLYKVQIKAPSRECAYMVVFNLTRDSEIVDKDSDNILYVIDPSRSSCENCDSSLTCSSRESARGCMACWEDDNMDDMDIRLCAGSLWTDPYTCGEIDTLSCVQPFQFRVNAEVDSDNFDESWLHYWHNNFLLAEDNTVSNNLEWIKEVIPVISDIAAAIAPLLGSDAQATMVTVTEILDVAEPIVDEIVDLFATDAMSPAAFSDIPEICDSETDKCEIIEDTKNLLPCEGEMPQDISKKAYHIWRTWVKIKKETTLTLKALSYNSTAVFVDGKLPSDSCFPSASIDSVSCSSSSNYACTFSIEPGWHKIDITLAGSEYSDGKTRGVLILRQSLLEQLKDRDAIFVNGATASMTSMNPELTNELLAKNTDLITIGISQSTEPKQIEYDRSAFELSEEDSDSMPDYEAYFQYMLSDVKIAGLEPSTIGGGTYNFMNPNAGKMEIDPLTGVITARAWCSFNCYDTLGDFDGNTKVEDADLALLETLLGAIQMTGESPYSEMPYCADVNGDNYITQEDMLCLIGLLRGQYSSFSSCPKCVPNSESEICNNGVDDNCDGQLDAEGYDNGAGELISEYGSDICSCNANTPCDTENLAGQTCFSLTASLLTDVEPYKWAIEPECSSQHEGYVKRCGGNSFVCMGLNGVYMWQ